MGFEEALSIRRSLPNLAVTLFADDSISFREAVREANTIGCGVEIQLSGDIVSNATFEAHCADPNALGIRVIGPAQIEGELRSRCTGPSCAWVSFENLLVENAAGDGFDCALDGKMVVLDSEANVTGPFNNALTGHGACRFVAIGVEGSSSGPDAAPTIALVDDSQGTLLGDGVFVSSSATRDSVVHLGGHSGGEVRLSIIGPVLTCRAADQFAIVFRPGFGGVTELVSSMLVANCPIDLRVQTAQTAVWASHRDSIPGIVDSPSTGDSEVTIDDSRGKRTLELPVALPDWLTGEGEVTHISIPRI
jgi:hypothetical protein